MLGMTPLCDDRSTEYGRENLQCGAEDHVITAGNSPVIHSYMVFSEFQLKRTAMRSFLN